MMVQLVVMYKCETWPITGKDMKMGGENNEEDIWIRGRTRNMENKN
jgi:hypothetical protein